VSQDELGRCSTGLISWGISPSLPSDFWLHHGLLIPVIPSPCWKHAIPSTSILLLWKSICSAASKKCSPEMPALKSSPQYPGREHMDKWPRLHSGSVLWWTVLGGTLFRSEVLGEPCCLSCSPSCWPILYRHPLLWSPNFCFFWDHLSNQFPAPKSYLRL
jgi:hypothetical protein